MKYMFCFALFLLTVQTVQMSCISTSSFPQGENLEYIEFGWGGGFTGVVHSYILLQDGRLFRNNVLNEEKEFIKIVDLDESNQLFKNYELLGLERLNLNKPGNTYEYILFKKKDKIHKLIWNNDPNNENLRLYYTHLRTLVK